MRVLVIGGSMFLGRAMVVEALRRGDAVTTFNRGRSRPDLPGGGGRAPGIAERSRICGASSTAVRGTP
jgi:uncharacterized protein YbjT (DUF2867 family)